MFFLLSFQPLSIIPCTQSIALALGATCENHTNGSGPGPGPSPDFYHGLYYRSHGAGVKYVGNYARPKRVFGGGETKKNRSKNNSLTGQLGSWGTWLETWAR